MSNLHTPPESAFAQLREQMECSGKPYCIAMGSYYNATYEHFSDFAEACDRYAQASKEVAEYRASEGIKGEYVELGFYAISQAPIRCLFIDADDEVPF